jgi:hypothetical protein
VAVDHYEEIPMKFMLTLVSDPALEPDPSSPEFEAYMGEWFAYGEALDAAGVEHTGEALQGVETATTVRVRDGQRIVTDGPFIESKEVVGGYYVLDVADLDAALGWAAKIPNIHFGTVEVRPIMSFD